MFGRPLCDNAYGYDAASRLASVSDGTNTASYGYLANSSLAGTLTLQRGGSTRLTTLRGYDNLNRLTNILNNAALTVSSGYGYNAANQRTNQWREDGTYWVYQYDALGQVTSGKKYWADGTPVAGQQFTYNFDTIGNRVSTAAGGDQNGLNLRAASYTNNSLNEITGRGVPGYVEVQGSASSNATVTVNGVAAYQKTNYYRAELTVNNLSSPVYPAVTNQGALGTNSVFINGHALVVQTPESFGYDADGNLTHDGKWSYTWDGENRLIALQSLATIPDAAKRRLQYMYDEAGRRIFAQLLEWNTNTLSYAVVTEQRYWYDGWNIIGRSDLATTLVQNFVWGSDLSGSLQGAGGVGGLLMVDDSKGASDFYAYDGNGNVLGLVNANDGTLAAQYDYGPFGEVLHLTGPSARANPFRFSTKYQDDESELLYYGYRYYNASTGRWPNRDPLSERGGINLFAFIGNNPINCYEKIGQQMAAPTLGPGCPDPCPILKAAIETALKVLRGRYMDMLMDVQNQYNNAYLKPPTPPYTTTWEGHEEQYNGVQNRLRNKLQEFYEEHCNDTLPPDTSLWAMEPAPIAPNSVQNPGVYGPPALPPGSTYDFITPQDVANSPITQNNPYAVNANPYSTTPGLNQQQLNEISILMLSPAAFAGATLLPEVSVPVLLRTAWAY